MRRRTCPTNGIRYMRLMVGTVRILTIPTGREPYRDHDSGGAGIRGEIIAVSGTGHGASQTGELQGGILARLGLGAVLRVSYRHAETGLESGYLATRQVINGLAAVGSAIPQTVANGGHALVGAIAGLEKEHGCPVVGKVLSGLARRAGRDRSHVILLRVHGNVEGVAADDLVQVRGGGNTGVDEAVHVYIVIF